MDAMLILVGKVVRLSIANSKTEGSTSATAHGSAMGNYPRAGTSGISADCPFVFHRDGNRLGIFGRRGNGRVKKRG